MRLVVGYLATPSGEDGLALGIQLARTLGAQLDLCIVLPPDRTLPGMVPTGGYEEILTEQAQQWLAQADGDRPRRHRGHPAYQLQRVVRPGTHRQRAKLGRRGDRCRRRRGRAHRPPLDRIGNRRTAVFRPGSACVGAAGNPAFKGGTGPRGDVRDRHPPRCGTLARTARAREPGGRQTAAPGFPRCARSAARRATRRRRIRARTCP